MQPSLAMPEPGLLVSWSASQLVRRYMAVEEKSPFLLYIPAQLFLAQRFHDEKLTLSWAAELAI